MSPHLAESELIHPTAEPLPPTGAGGLSFAFWVALFASAAVYATVVLAPKLITHAELARVAYGQQWQLVRLQDQIDYLERVAQAYEDPAFLREKVRQDFDRRPPGEEPIPLPAHLTLRIGNSSRTVRAEHEFRDPWYLPALRMVVAHPRLGSGLLLGSAVTVVLAFTFLQQPARTPRRNG